MINLPFRKPMSCLPSILTATELWVQLIMEHTLRNYQSLAPFTPQYFILTAVHPQEIPWDKYQNLIRKIAPDTFMGPMQITIPKEKCLFCATFLALPGMSGFVAELIVFLGRSDLIFFPFVYLTNNQSRGKNFAIMRF